VTVLEAVVEQVVTVLLFLANHLAAVQALKVHYL
jgi:hypothetical protein